MMQRRVRGRACAFARLAWFDLCCSSVCVWVCLCRRTCVYHAPLSACRPLAVHLSAPLCAFNNLAMSFTRARIASRSSACSSPPNLHGSTHATHVASRWGAHEMNATLPYFWPNLSGCHRMSSARTHALRAGPVSAEGKDTNSGLVVASRSGCREARADAEGCTGHGTCDSRMPARTTAVAQETIRRRER